MSTSSVAKLFPRLLSPRFIRFALVGFSGVFINLGVLFVLAGLLSVHEVAASAGAIEVSIIWNFLLNNAWTFRDKNAEAKVGFLERMYRYNVVSLIGAGVQLGTFVVLTRLAMYATDRTEPGYFIYPAQLAGIALGMAWNFVSNFHWTWAQRKTESSE